MKKFYLTPETDIVEMETSKKFLELSNDVDPLANEVKTFEDSDISTDLKESVNLWEE